MKQIIPFEHIIKFDNSIEEITSISLDKLVEEIRNNEITGVFDLYFEYKENDISVNNEKYSSKIPFNIDLDDKYILNNVKVDIDDFYYEIDEYSVLLHIDLLVDNLELKESELEVIIPKREMDDKEEVEERNIVVEDLFKEIDNPTKIEVPKEEIKDIKPIFETFDPSKETYVTYNVHIVRDNDNIESICTKYEVTKEELSYYNDITEIKLGDKLIVPTYKK